MEVFILAFIGIANVIAITLLWVCLKGLSQKEKLVFIAVGIAIMYLLVNAIFVFGDSAIQNAEAAQMTKNLMTFTFVPVNVILIEAYIARSYRLYKENAIKAYQFKRRCFVFGILLAILLFLEFGYFADIQESIQSMSVK